MKTGKPNKLDEIAEGMREMLADQEERAIHRPLAQGLQLVMARKQSQWRLAMGREGVYPSDVEVNVCRRAFKVPEAAEEERREASWEHPKTRRLVRFLVIELRWVDVTSEVVAV